MSNQNKDSSKPESKIEISRKSERSTVQAPDYYFEGTVWLEMLTDAPAPARVSTAYVTFEPGARTAWHTHPFGQTLIVTDGVGRIQRWDEQEEEIKAGDAVWIPPNVKHWHGASVDSSLTHIAIQEKLEGEAADWLEKVGNEA